MNYSDYDSDGYSSNEDVDYVPSDDNLSEDDLSQCEKEDPLDESDVVPHGHEGTTVATKKKKKKGQDITMRKRKKGGLKLEGEENEGGAAEEEKKDEAWEDADEQRTADVSRKGDGDSGQKKKADDLWASFLSDVGSRPKPSSCTPPSSSARQVDASVSKVSLSSSEPVARSSEPSKVTITKVFDFAGEEVRVTKEVSADSREAKSYLKNQSTAPGEEAEERDRPPAPDKPLLPGPSAKRPAGMSSLLNRLGGKKQKMSTLEKSKMDWDAFKSEEGITEELAIHNRGKEGYVERKNFLERVDHRQFEREKAVRLTHMKPT